MRDFLFLPLGFVPFPHASPRHVTMHVRNFMSCSKNLARNNTLHSPSTCPLTALPPGEWDLLPSSLKLEVGSSWSSGARTRVSWTWHLGACVNVPCPKLCPAVLFFNAFYKKKEMRKGVVNSCGLFLRALVLLVIFTSVLKHNFWLWDCWAFCSQSGQHRLSGPRLIPRHYGKANNNEEVSAAMSHSGNCPIIS